MLPARIVSLYWFLSWKRIFSSCVRVYVSLFSFFFKEVKHFFFLSHPQKLLHYQCTMTEKRFDSLIYTLLINKENSLTSFIRGRFKCEFISRIWRDVTFVLCLFLPQCFVKTTLPASYIYCSCAAFAGKASHTNDNNHSSLSCNLHKLKFK